MEKTPEVRVTVRYDIFKMSDHNRLINSTHLEKLKASIKENNLTMFNPIMVDRNMTIIDGQHRFYALKALGEPIYYVMVDSYTPEDLIKLNVTIKAWSRDDYIISYATRGHKACQKLLSDMEKYQVKSSPLLHIIYGDSGYWKNCQKDKMAHFNYPEDKQQLVKTVFTELEAFSGKKFYKEYRFIRAYDYVRRISDYEYSIMSTQAKKYISMVERQRSWTGYVINIVELYNYNRKAGKLRCDYNDLMEKTGT